MKKYDTGIAVYIGEDSYPIYLIVKELDKDDLAMIEYWKSSEINKEEKRKIKYKVWSRKYDLQCEHEIYALAWYDIYTEAIGNYENGKLKEVEAIK